MILKKCRSAKNWSGFITFQFSWEKKKGEKRCEYMNFTFVIFFFIKREKTGDLDVNLKCFLLSLNKVFQIPMPFYQFMQLKSLENKTFLL